MSSLEQGPPWLKRHIQKFVKSTVDLIVKSDCMKTNKKIKFLSGPETFSDICVQELSENFGNFLESKAFSDVTLKARDGTEFPAHKLFLAARSPVFSAMFQHDMAESHNGVVDMPDVEASTIREMLHYIYTGKLDVQDFNEAYNLYIVADKYELPPVKSVCRKVIKNSLSLDNCCDILIIAYMCDDKELKKALQPFMLDKWSTVERTRKWKRISRAKPSIIAEFFKDHAVASKEELTVLNVILQDRDEDEEDEIVPDSDKVGVKVAVECDNPIVSFEITAEQDPFEAVVHKFVCSYDRPVCLRCYRKARGE